MLFFKRRKKEKNLKKKYKELGEELLSEQDKKDPHKVEHYVIGKLEQIIEATKELEDQKSEYRMVTSYLNDIQTLEDIAPDARDKINDIAQNVVHLNQARMEFLHADKKISDAQFAQMQHEEKEIPAAIKRLKTNETYRETIKKDMKYLEREKSEWLFFREDLEHQQKKLMNLIYIVIGLAISSAIVIGILQFMMNNMPVSLVWTVFAFVVVAVICIIYIKILNAQAEYAKAKVNADRAIVLLNHAKLKYVNVTNAIDYACEKYHVTTSAELNKAWDAYLEAVKQREIFEKNSDDLEYYSDRLIRALSEYRLYDTRVWLPQAAALIDHNEMVEITHSLVTRRQKLRSRMEYSAEMIKKQREDVDRFLQNIGEMRPQIQEIVDSIDKLSSI